MKPLVIFGTGQLADLAWWYFSKKGRRRVVGFVVDRVAIKEPEVHGLSVLPYEDVEATYPAATHDLFIAIGSSKLNRPRAAKYRDAKAKGYKLATFISPDARVHADQVGDNCFIMDENNIHPFCRIGSNIIFSNDNHIGHHSVVEDHCFITSNVVVGGGARIGEGSFVGINATVRDHVSIGKYNLIGAGALILGDTADDEVYAVERTAPRKAKSDRVAKI